MVDKVAYKDSQKAKDHREWMDQIITMIQNRKWFGKLTIHFEAGELKRLVKEESLLPPSAAQEDKGNL